MRSPSARRPVPFVDLHTLHQEIATHLHDAWREVLDRSAFIGGVPVERFEREWAAYCGTRHAVGVSTGTDALRLALLALKIGPGDEVIVPANTFVATIEAVVAAGATPRLVDVDEETLLMTASGLSAAVTACTAAAVVVHLYGQMPDMDAIEGTCERAGIALIEDAAQAHGARWKGRRAGSWGQAGCFSFYPGKNLGALGDGGAVVSNDGALIERIRSLSNHGRARAQHHEHALLGGNYRLDALQAAMLSVKLPYLDSWNEARRRAAAHYEHLLGGTPVRPLTKAASAEHVHHLQVVRVAERDWVRERLRERGVETGVHYPIPVHLHAPYSRFCHDRLPIVEEAAQTILSLPMFPHLSPAQVEYVSQTLRDCAVEGLVRVG